MKNIQPLKMDLTEGSETSAKLMKNILHPAFEDGPDKVFRNVGKTYEEYSSSSL
jgi:hypothetical protein